MVNSKEICDSIVVKLNEYVEKNLETSGVTVDDMSKAICESKNWQVDYAMNIMDDNKDVGALTLILEAIQIPYDDKSVKRLERLFKLIYPEIKSGRIMKFIQITDLLIQAQDALMIGVENPKVPLTLELLQSLEQEYSTYLDMINDDNREFKLDEVMKALYYISNDQCRVLKGVIFPLMRAAFMFDKQEALREGFTETIGKLGWSVKDGQVFWKYK